jgi:hypothetical protein
MKLGGHVRDTLRQLEPDERARIIEARIAAEAWSGRKVETLPFALRMAFWEALEPVVVMLPGRI